MIRLLNAAFVVMLVLTGCGIKESIRRIDDRYLQPGALDMPLTGTYTTYQYRLVERYRITHHWTNTSSCAYRSTELPDLPDGRRSQFFVVPDIYESGGKTVQASNYGLKPMDFDPWVRSVKEVSHEKGKESETVEIGLRPVCFESWWKSSHYLRLRLQRRTLSDFESAFTQRYPEGAWSTRSANGLTWRVQQVATARLRPKPLNGIGGPYQAWLTALGDSGYVMSIEMGASQESLAHPKAHAEIEAVLLHLVRSLKVERLTP